MKKLLLILLCLPMIGFGQENRIKRGSLIKITNSEKITSRDKLGDIKKFIVYEDFLSSTGKVLVKKDTELTGKISQVKKARSFGRKGSVSLEISYINDIGGEPIRVSCTLGKEGKSRIGLYCLLGWLPPWVIQPFIIRGINGRIYEGEIFNTEVQESHLVDLQSVVNKKDINTNAKDSIAEESKPLEKEELDEYHIRMQKQGFDIRNCKCPKCRKKID